MKITEEEFHNIRGDKIAMIFQDPMSSLNLIMRVGKQLTEAMIIKGKLKRKQSRKDFNFTLECLRNCMDAAYGGQEADTPPNMIYPPKGDAFAERNKYAMEIDFEQQQPMFRISDTHYAATWLLHPDAPKVELPKVVTERIRRMKSARRGNTSVVKYFSDRIGVMYYGKMVELATSEELFAHPLHPYTKSLLSEIAETGQVNG